MGKTALALSIARHVALKMRQTVTELTVLFDQVFSRGANSAATPNLLAGADDEIDKLFQ